VYGLKPAGENGCNWTKYRRALNSTACEISSDPNSAKNSRHVQHLAAWIGAFLRLFRSRQSLLIENLALRQQLAVFKRQRRRPRLTATDRLFWLLLHRFWCSWKTASRARWPASRSRRKPRQIAGLPRPEYTRPCPNECRQACHVKWGQTPKARALAAPRVENAVVHFAERQFQDIVDQEVLPRPVRFPRFCPPWQVVRRFAAQASAVSPRRCAEQTSAE
jgi:hypothetical protein